MAILLNQGTLRYTPRGGMQEVAVSNTTSTVFEVNYGLSVSHGASPEIYGNGDSIRYSVVMTNTGSGTLYAPTIRVDLAGGALDYVQNSATAFLYSGTDVQELPFTVTLDEIWQAPELTDELCKANTPYQTAKEYFDTLKTDCIFQYAYEKLLQQCTIKAYPDEYTEYYQQFVDFFTTQASDYSVTLEDFLKDYGDYFLNYGIYSGMTTAEFYRVAENYAESNLVNDLLMYSLLRAEGIEANGAEYKTATARLETEYGMSYDELIANYETNSVIISILNIALANKLVGYVKVN